MSRGEEERRNSKEGFAEWEGGGGIKFVCILRGCSWEVSTYPYVCVCVYRVSFVDLKYSYLWEKEGFCTLAKLHTFVERWLCRTYVNLAF